MSSARKDRNDWYQRWIDGIADDVADNMEGEPERQARMDDLHDRLAHLRDRLRTLKPVHRGRGPTEAGGSPRSEEDARIQADVAARLRDDLYVDATGIAVAVNGGYVTLTGTIDSRAAKRLAEDCADTVAGVHDVHNNIRIA